MIHSKHAQTQISHLESHGESLEVHTKYFQRQDQRLQKHSEDLQKQGQQIKETRDILLSAKSEPRWITPHPRAQSVMSMPVASSSSAVVAPEMYVQGHKSLADVQDLLEQVNSEIDDLQRDENEKNVLRNIQAELEDVEERILKSIERNGAKGVQNALAENVLYLGNSIRRVSSEDLDRTVLMLPALVALMRSVIRTLLTLQVAQIGMRSLVDGVHKYPSLKGLYNRWVDRTGMQLGLRNLLPLEIHIVRTVQAIRLSPIEMHIHP